MLSAVFAVLFALSLRKGHRPLCLAFAERISDGIVPEGAAAYCRRLTWIWLAVLSTGAAIGLVGLLTRHGFVSALVSPALFLLTFAIELPIRRRRFQVVFHTSGSTGRSKTIVKTFESLAREVAYHRRHYAATFARPASVTFVGTVQRDHMYGKLWMDLLPKAAGAQSVADVIRSPEELLGRMKSSEKVFLVTTPSFLNRFLDYADLYDIPHNCVEIVTSGSRLAPETAARAATVFGIRPRQIYGSTETGGIASCRETDDLEIFDPVRAKVADGRLAVRSPFSFCRGWYLMGDGVRLSADGRSFKLLGRLDRLVKINEERVNLAEMEEKVRALGFADCALAPLNGRHGAFLGCVLVPKAGDADLAPLALRRRLLPVFPSGTVPKRFRTVGELPRNPQGKVLAAEVVRLLEETEITLRFTGQEHFFQGHFPGVPVLPGFVQLGRAVEESVRFYGIQGPLRLVKKMKFVHVIEPDRDIVLRLARKAENEIAYEFTEGDAACSSGTLVF